MSANHLTKRSAVYQVGHCRSHHQVSRKYRPDLFFISLAFCALTTWCQAETPLLSPKKPNIVLIISDDQAWNDYHFIGHPYIKTPNIDALAYGGVTFENGYVANSICRPSLASLITGLYPYQHGITTNARKINTRPTPGESTLPAFTQKMQKQLTIPGWLQEQGYVSFQAGKWWEEAFTNGRFTHGEKNPDEYGFAINRKNNIGREGMEPLFTFVKENKDKPMFIWYAPQLPHTPFNPPKKFLSFYSDLKIDNKQKAYAAMISWFDQTVGELVSFFEDQNLNQNTIFIFLADNGYILKNDLLHRSHSQGKLSPYDGGSRTPIIFYWPQQWPSQNRLELASSLDIFPTIMELINKNQTDSLPGQSLLALLKKDESAKLRKDYVAGEGYGNASTGNLEDNPRIFRWLRQDNWKIIEHNDRPLELYNINSDPAELHNLAHQQPEKTNALQQLLNAELPLSTRLINEKP